MRNAYIAVAAALMLGTAPLASAQPIARAAEAQTTRDAKSQAVTPPRPGRVERFLDMMERRGLLANLVAPRDGIGLRVGGIDEGGGLALGPSWQYSSLAGGHVQLHASAAMSIRRDREVEFGVRLPPGWRPPPGARHRHRDRAWRRRISTGSAPSRCSPTAALTRSAAVRSPPASSTHRRARWRSRPAPACCARSCTRLVAAT